MVLSPIFELVIVLAGFIGGFFALESLQDETPNALPEDEEMPVEPVGDEPTVDMLELGARAVINGDENDNVIAGTTDAERIEAGAGNDTITSIEGDDQILAGEGDDIVTAAGIAFGEAGDDILTAAAEGTELVGGEGNDTLNANGVSATFWGGTGDDTLNVSNDVAADGGEGADLFVLTRDAEASSAQINDFVLGEDSLAFAQADTEAATALSITALGGGEEGLLVTASFAPSDDLETETPRVVEVALLGVTDAEALEAAIQAQMEDGTLAEFTVTQPPEETPAEEPAEEDPEEEPTEEAPEEGQTGETIEGTDGDDTFAAGDGDDTVNGRGGVNTGTLGGGDDTYTGGGTSETIDGGAGNDRFIDILPAEGDVGLVRYEGGVGDDSFIAARGTIELIGGDGNDTFTLSDNGGFADGGAGSDIFQGGDGADQFLLDEDDTVTGGAGADEFTLVADENDIDPIATTITDFDRTQDVLRIVVPDDGAEVVVLDDENGQDAIVRVNGDRVATLQGGAGTTLNDLEVVVA